MENFLSGIMDDSTIPDNLMEECYMCTHEGTYASLSISPPRYMSEYEHIDMTIYAYVGYDVDDMELDTPTDLFGAESIDPFDFVYSNLPKGTHILKQEPDCEHCNAKKFEHETDGFYCRNGNMKLAESEPIPELMRLWSSADADSRHFGRAYVSSMATSHSQLLASAWTTTAQT
ncbi:hypothetical protein QYE76_057489 [Lolium multiflorum]|uniref:Uncharacterized protein n=1 Tax=Lolium multiflorum TaxID=4521 RepID=A0AAD8T550_LOLMU|nr:hypothetical protein QYE76_057489 [Lolium multiflorum]